MKLNLMTQNLQISIEEIAKNQDLIKLITVNSKNPLLQENINISNILFNNIFPEPYNEEIPEEQKVELRIFYPNGTFDKSNNIAISDLYFQIISHRNLERIFVGDRATLRSIEIMNKIVEIFKDKSFKNLGTILFKGYEYAHINKDYFMYTLVAEVMNL